MLKVFLNALCLCQENNKDFKTWWFFVKWFLQYHDKNMTHNDQMMQTIISKDIYAIIGHNQRIGGSDG